MVWEYGQIDGLSAERRLWGNPPYFGCDARKRRHSVSPHAT
jgi:hypothetical protein